MVLTKSSYLGGLRCSAEHTPSGAVIHTDAPVDNHGKGEAFSPTDLVGTALVTCVMTIMGLTARRLGIALEGAVGRVEKHMVADPHRRISRLDVIIENLPRGLDKEARAALEDAADTCPVTRSLHPDTTVALEFRWE
jgi:uncharacterized OsmC-like protein